MHIAGCVKFATVECVAFRLDVHTVDPCQSLQKALHVRFAKIYISMSMLYTTSSNGPWFKKWRAPLIFVEYCRPASKRVINTEEYDKYRNTLFCVLPDHINGVDDRGLHAVIRAHLKLAPSCRVLLHAL